MAKHFGALEEQAAKDRELLTGLVSQVKQQTQGQSQKKVTTLLSPESVTNYTKSTCQSNVAKQRHKSGPKHMSHPHINTMHRGSLFSRDNINISTGNNIFSDATLNGAGVINTEQVNSYRSYDMSQSNCTQQSTHHSKSPNVSTR